MLIQPWLTDSAWVEHDPKMQQLRQQPLVLGHTAALVEKIPLSPVGIVFVRGPRQCGKSTFLRQYILKALKDGILPSHIGLIEAEACEDRHELLGSIEEFTDKTGGGKSLLLIDEISSIEKWWLALKIAADQGKIKETLLICTGSASEEISQGADLLPGRRGKRSPIDFDLLPVRFADIREHLSLDDYFLTGGLPWAVNEFIRQKTIPPYIYELYGAWIQGVFVRQRHSIVSIPPMLRYITQRVGTPLSVLSMTRDCGIGSNNTSETYLSLLERNYALFISSWQEPGTEGSAPRKNRKFFPADPLLFHLYSDFGRAYDLSFANSLARCADPQCKGRLAECIVAAELRRRPGMYPLHYFLGKREIDFMGEEAAEVKYQNRVSIEEFAWTRKVLPAKMRLTVVTRDSRSSAENIRCVPLEQWLGEGGN